jgi:carboxyl-terminal processing protease
MKLEKILTLCFIILFSLVFSSCSISGSSSGDYLSASIAAPEAPLLAEVIMHLQLDYVHPEKLEPKKLLQGALTELGRMVPEVWVVPEFEENGHGAMLQVRLEKETTVLNVDKLNGLYDLHITLQKLMKHLLQKNSQLTQLKLEQLFARGILNQLDAYSVLLSNDIYQEFSINIGGQFAGIGLVVGIRDGQLTVISPMDGSPAAQAGMKPLDRIVEVDDEKTEHLTLNEILLRLRGEVGAPITLGVLRKGHANALKFELLREEIKVESVETFDLKSGNQTVRYVRIKNFQIDTSQELKNKLGDLVDISGLLLDLRNNPGGLLQEAVRVSDLFLAGKQRIVSTKGASVSTIHDAKQLFASVSFQDIPLVVLINRGSASASEIVAAALKQNKRAIVIGEQSFGKGTVQTLWDLKDGSGLKLTIGEYLTPSGLSIHNIGVMPELSLIPVNVPSAKNLQGADDQQQSVIQERFSLLTEKTKENSNADSERLELRYLSGKSKVYDDFELIAESEIIEKLNADIFVETAKRVLIQWNPEDINSGLLQISREVALQESHKITKALAEHGIDWSLNPFLKTPAAENLSLTWFAEEISVDQVQLKVKLRNTGELAGQRLLVVTKSGNVLLDGLEFPLGLLGPDSTAEQTLKVKYFAGMMEETEPLELELFDQNLKKLKSVRLKLHFSPKRIPSFRLAMKIYDNGELGSQGNGDGKVQSGEIIALAFKLANKGKKTVPELLLKIRGTEGSFRINRGKLMLKNLEPDHEQKDYFIFQTLKDTRTLGKISLEMVDTKSGAPKIVNRWNLQDTLPEQMMVTPNFSGLKWQDLNGNLVLGETALQSLILSGKVSNAADVRDVFVHLNDEKVFYSANLNHLEDSPDQQPDNEEFRFSTLLELVPGKNQISVFSRNRYGFTSERRLRILRRQ